MKTKTIYNLVGTTTSRVSCKANRSIEELDKGDPRYISDNKPILIQVDLAVINGQIDCLIKTSQLP